MNWWEILNIILINVTITIKFLGNNFTFIFFSNFRYKSRDDFVNDVRQIFDNCEVFNEDDSPVGKAGHGMRKYFEMRWNELTDKQSWHHINVKFTNVSSMPPE